MCLVIEQGPDGSSTVGGGIFCAAPGRPSWLLDMNGNSVEGALHPSSDAKNASGAQAFPEIGGVVHTPQRPCGGRAQAGRISRATAQHMQTISTGRCPARARSRARRWKKITRKIPERSSLRHSVRGTLIRSMCPVSSAAAMGLSHGAKTRLRLYIMPRCWRKWRKWRFGRFRSTRARLLPQYAGQALPAARPGRILRAGPRMGRTAHARR